VKNEFLCHHFLYILTTLSIGEGKIVRRDKTIFGSAKANIVFMFLYHFDRIRVPLVFNVQKIVSLTTCSSLK
jgi:hypothetical protein